MRLYLRLAWRNVWRHRRRTIIIVLAMAGGLSLMMWYDGLIDGFDQAIYGNAVKVLGGNIQVHAEGYRAKAALTPLLPLAAGHNWVWLPCLAMGALLFQALRQEPFLSRVVAQQDDRREDDDQQKRGDDQDVGQEQPRTKRHENEECRMINDE